MNEERFEELQKKVNYLNDEGFAGEGKKFILFRNGNEAIEAIRSNKVPGITWDAEQEAKWQAIDSTYNSEENISNWSEEEWEQWFSQELNEDIDTTLIE
jgi:hypothetical protein